MSGVIRCVFASCSRHQLRLTAGQQMCDSYQLCVRPTYSMLVLMSEPEVYQPLLFQSGLSTRKKKKNKKLLLSFLTCRRFCVGCWCKPHGFFFCVCFPLISKSLVLKSGFEAVSAAFSYDFLNGRLEYHEFQRKHPLLTSRKSGANYRGTIAQVHSQS